MPAIELPSLADHVRSLPAEGAGRDRQLQRFVDLYASNEAAAALRVAAASTDEGVLAGVLKSADAVLASGLADRGLSTDDAAVRDRLRDAVVSPEFLSLLPDWIRELRQVASSRPDTGACTVASALDLWSWTMKHFRTGEGEGTDNDACATPGMSARESASQAIDELADALCPLLAARCLALDLTTRTVEGSLDGRGSFAALHPPGVPPAQDDTLRSDLCHVHAARASALAGAACAELVFGYRRHLVWDAEGCAACYAGDELDDLEALMPGIASGARMTTDVVEADGSHPEKAGPCARFDGVDTFMRLRNRLDGCLTGARIAKDRAAAAIARSMAAAAEGRV
jgi:hypothetical protein